MHLPVYHRRSKKRLDRVMIYIHMCVCHSCVKLCCVFCVCAGHDVLVCNCCVTLTSNSLQWRSYASLSWQLDERYGGDMKKMEKKYGFHPAFVQVTHANTNLNHLHKRTHMHTAHIHTHDVECTYMTAYRCVDVYIYAYVYVWVCMRVWKCVASTCVCMCACMCACVHIHTYIDTHR